MEARKCVLFDGNGSGTQLNKKTRDRLHDVTAVKCGEIIETL